MRKEEKTAVKMNGNWEKVNAVTKQCRGEFFDVYKHKSGVLANRVGIGDQLSHAHRQGVLNFGKFLPPQLIAVADAPPVPHRIIAGVGKLKGGFDVLPGGYLISHAHDGAALLDGVLILKRIAYTVQGGVDLSIKPIQPRDRVKIGRDLTPI